MNTFYTFKNTFLIAEKQLEITMNYAWEYETESVEGDFDFGSAKENKAYLKRFHDGELECVLIRVQAHFEGLTGDDYLGMCHIRAGSVDDLMQCVCEHAMEFHAREDLERQIIKIADALK
jgi:hypothetical protein